MNVICACGWLAVFVGGIALRHWAAAACIAGGAALFGLGECFVPLQSGLVSDIAPEALRGRYLALISTATQLGLVVGPTLGGLLLEHAPRALWPTAAAVLLVTALAALALKKRVPTALRRTPAKGAAVRRDQARAVDRPAQSGG
jgi:MFS family permease